MIHSAIEIITEPAITPADDRAIRALLCECFLGEEYASFRESRYWHDSAPAFTALFREGDRVSGHVGVVIRGIRCDGQPTTVAGVQNVAVTPHLRRTGISHELMQKAMAEAARRGIRFGMLFCFPGLERLYGSLGWCRVEASVTMIDDSGEATPIDPRNITMVKGLASEQFAAKEIDLAGPDW